MHRSTLSAAEHPARAWVSHQHFQWAASDDTVAGFLHDLDLLLDEVVTTLAGVPTPVIGGWGGALVRVRRPDGDLAVKIPFAAESVCRNVEDQQMLHSAGLCPQVVEVRERWFAMDWVDAPPIGCHLLQYHLDAVGALDVLERLAALTPTRPDDRDRIRRHTDVPAHRRDLLRRYGLDPDTVDERVTTVRESLFAASSHPRVLHGDLQGGNILALPGRFLTVDPQVRSDGQEQEVAWLLTGAHCGHIPVSTMARFANVLELDAERIDAWSMVYSAEWLACVLDSFPERRRTAELLAVNLTRLCAGKARQATGQTSW